MISDSKEEIVYASAEFGKHALSCAVTISKSTKRSRTDEEEEEGRILPPAKLIKRQSSKCEHGNTGRTLVMVSEYREDIFKYLHQRERAMIPTHNYIQDEESAHHIEAGVRAILVDWLVEVHQKFKYVQETLLLALAIMDRFLSQSSVSNAKLQLLAVTSLFIAAKFEEIHLPRLSNYAYITDGAATAAEIRTAEAYILKCLRFDVSIPSPLNFLTDGNKADAGVMATARYILEYMYCCPHFIQLKPSQTSSLAMRLARAVSSSETHQASDNTVALPQEYKDLVQEFADPSTSMPALLAKHESAGSESAHTRISAWCKKHLDEP